MCYTISGWMLFHERASFRRRKQKWTNEKQSKKRKTVYNTSCYSHWHVGYSKTGVSA